MFEKRAWGIGSSKPQVLGFSLKKIKGPACTILSVLRPEVRGVVSVQQRKTKAKEKWRNSRQFIL